MHQEGIGADYSPKKALYWYTKSANQNNAKAQYLLAKMYEQGMGDEVDRAPAKIWYKKACNNGLKKSCAKY